MTGYPPDARVTVRPFARRPEGDLVTIGDMERQVFLSIPQEGVDVLDWLAAGDTVGEAVRRYEEKYGATPDIQDFLDTMQQEGFLVPCGDAAAASPERRTRRGGHLSWISERAARRIFGRTALICYGLLVGAALVLVALDPGLIPGSSALVYPHDFALLSWITFAVALGGLMVHEAAHVVAARAAGVPARIGLGNQLYIPVAQTDMSGIWLAPKRARYLGFLSGAIVDAVCAALLVYLGWVERRGWVDLPDQVTLLARGILFTYLARILWQCFLFLRTDFYYTIATALDCKSLLTDTEDFLRNILVRLRLARQWTDQSALPRKEMWAVRLYAVLWLGGRIVAIGALIFVTVPLLGAYLWESGKFLIGADSRFGFWDFVTSLVLGIGVTGLGLVLWGRSIYLARARRRARAARRTGAEDASGAAGAHRA